MPLRVASAGQPGQLSEVALGSSITSTVTSSLTETAIISFMVSVDLLLDSSLAACIVVSQLKDCG